MFGQGLHHCRNCERQRWPVTLDGGECQSRLEPAMQQYGATTMQRRGQLVVDAANMEQWQVAQNDIGAGHVVGMGAVYSVPEYVGLAEECALRLAGRAGGIDQKHRRLITGRGDRDCSVPLWQYFPAFVTRADPEETHVLQFLANPPDVAEEGMICEQGLRRTVLQLIEMLGRGQPPVQRHQDRAEPCAGKQKGQLLDGILAKVRDAIARSDAGLPLQRTGHARYTRREIAVCDGFTVGDDCRFVRRLPGPAGDPA